MNPVLNWLWYVALCFFCTLYDDWLFAIRAGWYHTVPCPFRSLFFVTIVSWALKCKIRLFCIMYVRDYFSLENKSTIDWLFNSIQLLGLTDMSCKEHSTSLCMQNLCIHHSHTYCLHPISWISSISLSSSLFACCSIKFSKSALTSFILTSSSFQSLYHPHLI